MRRWSHIAQVVLTVAVATSPVWVASAAQAGVTNFSLAPTSGPTGTVVSVSGSGCTPGLVRSSSLDYVQVAMTTVPSTSAHLAVAANGTWQGTLTVPANAAAATSRP